MYKFTSSFKFNLLHQIPYETKLEAQGETPHASGIRTYGARGEMRLF